MVTLDKMLKQEKKHKLEQLYNILETLNIQYDITQNQMENINNQIENIDDEIKELEAV